MMLDATVSNDRFEKKRFFFAESEEKLASPEFLAPVVSRETWFIAMQEQHLGKVASRLAKQSRSRLFPEFVYY